MKSFHGQNFHYCVKNLRPFKMFRQSEILVANSNDLVVENLKRMLISRDTETQLKAVVFINKTCEKFEDSCDVYNGLIEHFIYSDISVFLCEASATFHHDLLLNILRCLKRFSTFSIFYKKSYSPNVVASVIRTIHFLVKENSHEALIMYSLYFLSEIFFKINNEKICPVLSIQSSYNAPQLLELMYIVIEKENLQMDTKLAASLMLHSLLCENKLQIDIHPKTLSQSIQLIIKVQEVLSQLLIEGLYKHCSENKPDCLLGMVCHLCIDSLYFIKNVEKMYVDENEEMVTDDLTCESRDNYKESVYLSVQKILTSITSHIQTFDSSVLDQNESLFLELLNMFLCEPLAHNIISSFADHLCANNFLLYLPQRRAISQNTKIRWLYQANLAELLNILSMKYLKLSNWYGGQKEFTNQLYKGLMTNDSHPNEWPQILNDNESSEATINALIIYLYFYCLTSSDPLEDTNAFLPYLVDYILNLPRKIKCPEPIIKCLWFIFAVASSNNCGAPYISGGKLTLERAKSKMAVIASVQTQYVYTHHPALVIWAFSSNRIPTNIQHEVLSMWLEMETTLPLSLTENMTVWCSLLEIIINGHRNTKVAAVILKSFIERHSVDDNISYITSILWDSLPEAISSYVVGRCSIDTAICMFELCSLNIPEKPLLSTVQRSSTLLLTLLSTPEMNDPKLRLPFIQQAFALLNISLREDDVFVLSQFMNSPKLLQFIYNATQSIDIDLSLTAMKILSFTSHYKQKYNLQCDNVVKLEISSIINSLKEDSRDEKINATLQLVYTVLTSKANLPPFVVFCTEYPVKQYVNTFRTIFFRLQMVCCKESKNESKRSWMCLNSMLSYAAYNSEDLVVALTTQPWTHMLIRFYLNQNKPSKASFIFLKFVNTWLTCFKVINTKQKIFTIKNNDNASFKNEHNILFGTLGLLVNTFDDEDVQVQMDERKKSTVLNILILISNIFD